MVVMDLYYWDEMKENPWVKSNGTSDFKAFLIQNYGLQKADVMLLVTDDGFMGILNAYQSQRNEKGATEILDVLANQGMTYLSINPTQEVTE